MNGIYYDLLDQILPSSDSSKPHDILRLEYLSACKVMENENNFIKILPQIPAVMFVPLLQSVIYKCYLDFIDIDNISIRYFNENMGDYQYCLNERKVAFPESLWILILNWPHTELVLRNKMPSLHPSVDFLQAKNGPLAKQILSFCHIDDISEVFDIFCYKLIQFITQAIFKCSPRNTRGFSCNLRRLDLSRLANFSNSQEYKGCFPWLINILDGIRKSDIKTFGHKIEMFADAEVDFTADSVLPNGGLEFLSNIVKANLEPAFGISVYFKKIYVPPIIAQLPSDFYNVLSLGRCEYIVLDNFDIDRNLSENLCTHLPGLVGLGFQTPNNTESLDFLGEFEHLEQFYLERDLLDTSNNLVNSISNMSKGLKYLGLYGFSLRKKDFECLGNSIHSDTLLELKLSGNAIGNESEVVGLIMLFHKLNKVKVITLDTCSLETLSSHTVTKLVTAFKDCTQLEFLSLWENPFSLEITNIIVEVLSENKSLRYLSLDLPTADDDGDNDDNDDDEDIVDPNILINLCKSFHETINKLRNSPLYISWQ